MTEPVRRIIHIDMDAFYASVEQRDAPALRGRPLAVGRSQERGVVAAASYEARKFGVRSAMPSVVAQRKCPELIFVPPRFEVYRAISAQIHAIFARYTPLIQPLSLDEAYLDVTTPLLPRPSATAIAQEIRAAIHAETGLTASAGVSYNKFLAKLASDYRKPNGQFVIPPGAGEAFVADLPVSSFHGIGPATATRMNGLGIYTGADLRRQSLAELSRHFGKAATFYYGIARGEDHRPVEPHRPRKSIGKETTYERDLYQDHELYSALTTLAQNVWHACTRRQTSGRTLTLKLRYVNFQQLTRSSSLTDAIASANVLEETAQFLLRPLLPLSRPVRLLGLTVSSLTSVEERPATEQLSLLSRL